MPQQNRIIPYLTFVLKLLALTNRQDGLGLCERNNGALLSITGDMF